jgi:hypothetical protein
MGKINCQFNTPIDLGDGDYEYSQLECDPVILQLVQNEETEAEFYLQKTIDYGDILLISILSIFLIFGMLKFLTDFLIPKLVNFRRK